MIPQDEYTLISTDYVMEKLIKIHDIIKETSDSITVEFVQDEYFNAYESGQFINVFESTENESISRSYSFSSSPIVDPLPAITIKKVPGGRISSFLVDQLKGNRNLKVSKPLGRFGLGKIADNGHLVFIAGGSGITPLFSMIKTALHSTSRLKITLLYGNKNVDSIIFLNKLDELEKYAKGRLDVIHFLDDYPYEFNFEVIEGHISKEFLDSFLQRSKKISGYYICGPMGMMKSVKSNLEALGVEPDLIHVESFGNNLKNDSAKVSKSSKITFIKQDGNLQLDVPMDKFILDTGLKSGLKLPHSCNEAMCGTCMVKILSGKVKMQENYALTDEQINDGYTLLCSGLPITDEIILSYL